MGSNPKKDEKKRRQNKSEKSSVATFYKKAQASVSTVSALTRDEVFAAIAKFESLGMRASRKFIFSKKSISRRVSRLVSLAKAKFGENVVVQD